jgi:hypothetical protein
VPRQAPLRHHHHRNRPAPAGFNNLLVCARGRLVSFRSAETVELEPTSRARRRRREGKEK